MTDAVLLFLRFPTRIHICLLALVFRLWVFWLGIFLININVKFRSVESSSVAVTVRHHVNIRSNEQLTVCILRGRLMPLYFKSQNNLKFLHIEEEMTNSNGDSRVTLPNQIICYSVQMWIDWKQNLVKQMIRWMPPIVKNTKYGKQLTWLDSTWDICTLHSSCLFLLA